MNVPSILMAVLITVSTPLDPTHAAVELDTNWLPTDTPVKVYYKVCNYDKIDCEFIFRH